MGFSDYLKENIDKERYLGKYLKYDELIRKIKKYDDGDKIAKIIGNEFDRIFGYINEQTEFYKVKLGDIEIIDVKSLSNNHILITEFDKLQEDMKAFAEFIRINIVGFKKAIKHSDKKTNGNLVSKYKDILDEKLKAIEHLDELIYKGSRLKLMTENVEGLSSVNLSFIRKTNKYWVHSDNLMALKLAIVKHLPLYVFTAEKETDEKPYAAWNHKTHNTCVSSVYFDNDNHDLYKGRLHKDEGAEAIRIRWYGELKTNKDVVYIERKRHCESWTGEKSKKLRFKIEERFVNDYLKGKNVWKHVKQLNGDDVKVLYEEIQNAVLRQNLKPSVRTFYKRVAFQLPNDASVRISLDTNLSMIDESTTNNNWRRLDCNTEWPFNQLDDQNIVRFPHAILEVKTQGIDESKPKWIEELVNSPYVEHVHKFSKFLHGTAILHDGIDEIPYWLPQMRTDIRKDPFLSVKKRKGFIDNNLVDISSVQNSNCSSVQDSRNTFNTNSTNNNHRFVNDEVTRISIPVRVEPKVFFANERTFLKWVQFAIFLGGIGTAMLGLNNYHANICGAMLMGVAIAFAVYALHLFFWRMNKIRRREPDSYEDTKGPLVLVIVFICVLVLSIYFKFPMKK